MTIAFGGTNAKIGKDNHGREENMKKQVVGLTKKMESSLRSFLVVNTLVIEGAIFATRKVL